MKKYTIPLSAPDITKLEVEKVLEVLKSHSLSRGKKIKEFEKKIAEYIGVPYAIAVNSGTSALHLSVKSIGLEEGDEVITTPFSFIASSNCLLMEKVRPVFVDINPLTYNLDPKLIEDKITSKTKAILPVDIFGVSVDIDEIRKIAKKYNLYIIEDSCEALGAEYKNERVGKNADVATFAFYPNKQITTGEGGIIVTSNEKIANLCKSMRSHGRNEKEDWLTHKRIGYNYWMSELNAALGIGQMERIEEIIIKREKVAKLYMEKLKHVDGLELPYSDSKNKISWFVFVVRVDGKIRDVVMDFLQKSGIECRNYFSPIHLQPLYRKLFGYKEGDFPITEKISKQTIALPFYNNLREKDIDYTVNKLEKVIEKYGN